MKRTEKSARIFSFFDLNTRFDSLPNLIDQKNERLHTPNTINDGYKIMRRLELMPELEGQSPLPGRFHHLDNLPCHAVSGRLSGCGQRLAHLGSKVSGRNEMHKV